MEPGLENELLPEFWQGIEEFNAGQFFACHETLELVWRKQSSEKREFTQGIIQTAVGFYHLERNNRPGALKLFQRALPRLLKFGPVCFGVDVPPLALAVGKTLALLEKNGETTETALPAPPKIKITS